MKKRLISAFVILLIFIPLLLLGGIYYTVFGSILGILAIWEVINLEKKIPNYMRIITYFVGLFLILYNYKYFDFYSFYSFPVVIIVAFIYILSIIINKNCKKYDYRDALWLMTVAFLMGIFFNSFIKIRLLGVLPVLYCFVVSCMTDTFAYIGGTVFGKNKLCKDISPNKTVEGSIIGSIMGTVIGTTFYHLAIGNINIYTLILLSFILTIVCQIGDLFFSSIKRYYGIKDYSNLIPGHGGILDRLDSTLFVILGFLVYISII